MSRVDARAEIEELRALASKLLERIQRLGERAMNDEKPAVDREPPAEAYAKVAARRRRRGR